MINEYGRPSREEPRYTAAEWLRREDLAECAEAGHYYQTLETNFGDDLVGVYCVRCRRMWKVTEETGR